MRKRKIMRRLSLLFLVIALGLGGWGVYEHYASVASQKLVEEMQQIAEMESEEPETITIQTADGEERVLDPRDRAALAQLMGAEDGIEEGVEEETGEDATGEAGGSGSGGIQNFLDPLFRRIDFASLQRRNPQIHTWVYIPNTYIDYPVIQEAKEGEYYFLWRDLDGNENRWGSIFSPKTKYDEEATELIFGHRTISREYAFSSLIDFEDRNYAYNHRYVYRYYPDRAEIWQIYTGGHLKASSSIYNYGYEIGADNYEKEILDEADYYGLYALGEKPDKNTRSLLLSTCYGQIYDISEGRFFLQSTPLYAYYYATNELRSIR